MPQRKLLTKADERRLPPLYTQDGKGYQATAYVKFFTPWADWTWYATEYNPQERIFFGLVIGHETELGYFSLDELESVRGPAGIKIERDAYFEPQTLADITSKGQ